MKEIRIETAQPYSVWTGAGASDALPDLLTQAVHPRRVLIVTDDRVAPLHLARMETLLAGFACHSCILPAGEEHKNMDTVLTILGKLQECQFDRDDAVLALGGGVVGDMAAFAASIYRRGIAFVNVPTTLLSQVDSSVGGKTGVDFQGLKNVIGTFCQPRLVVCDTDYTRTLPPEIFADGCAEIVKYAFIGDDYLLSLLSGGIGEDLDLIVARCVEDKGSVIAADERDRGTRQFLNFGHTVGHAIETLSEYEISHGSAVAMGMYAITRAAVSAGLCAPVVRDRLTDTLTEVGLPYYRPSYTPKYWMQAIRSDKKVSGDAINVVLPVGVCQCVIRKLTLAQLGSLLERAFPL